MEDACLSADRGNVAQQLVGIGIANLIIKTGVDD